MKNTDKFKNVISDMNRVIDEYQIDDGEDYDIVYQYKDGSEITISFTSENDNYMKNTILIDGE